MKSVLRSRRGERDRETTASSVGTENRPGSGTSRTFASTVTSLTYAEARLTPAQRRVRRALRLVRRTRRRASRWTLIASRAVTGVVTPLGWGTVVVTAAALLIGYAAGWQEFAIVGIALLLLCALSALQLIGRMQYDVTLHVDQDRTSVGRSVRARVVLTDGRRPLWGGRLEVQVGDEAVQVRLPARLSGTTTNEFEVPAERRGVITVGPVRAVRGDPIGLFRRDVEWTEVVDVHVHPETVSVPSTSTGFIRDLEGNPTRDLTSSDISFHALREYRPGDERRHIHWKATARTGELTVRQFEETRRSHLVIAFGLAPADYASEEEFEMAVSAASSIAIRALRDGRDLSVVTSPPSAGQGEEPARVPAFLPVHGHGRYLDAVSALRFGSSNVGVGALASLASTAVEGISLVFLVVGSAPSIRELRSWSLRFPPGVEIVVVVCGPGHLPTLRRVAELSVVTIGYLDDLRRSLSRSAA